MAGNSIYYMFGTPPQTGGHFVAMEHVAALNALGFDAKAFFHQPGPEVARLGIPVAAPGTRIQPNDIVVVGEADGPVLDPLYTAVCIKILHDQSPYYTPIGFGTIARLNAFGFRRIIVPSDFCAAKLAELGVTAPITRVRPALPDYFQPGPKQLQIAFSPRKRLHEAVFLKEYFRAQAPEYADVPWRSLTNVSRQEAAAIMGQSPVYVALPMLESLGLMSLEAMASGCHVVGYTGLGGAEYATPENADWIDEGDHQGFVAKMRAALRLHESGTPDPKLEAGRKTAAQFTRETFEKELKAAWLAIVGEDASRYRKA